MAEHRLIEAACKYLSELFDTIRALEQRLKTTEEIIQSINLQEVSRLLEMEVGDEISLNIVPYIQKMRRQYDSLQVAHVEAQKEIIRYEKAEERHKNQETPSDAALERAEVAERALQLAQKCLADIADSHEGAYLESQMAKSCLVEIQAIWYGPSVISSPEHQEYQQDLHGKARELCKNSIPGLLTATEAHIEKSVRSAGITMEREFKGHIRVHPRIFHPNPGDEDGPGEKSPTTVPTEDDQGADGQ